MLSSRFLVRKPSDRSKCSCRYGEVWDSPVGEESLLTGRLVPSGDAYAIAKIAGVLGIQAARWQRPSAVDFGLYGEMFHNGILAWAVIPQISIMPRPLAATSSRALTDLVVLVDQ